MEETYKAENSDEIVWLRLNRLKSVKLCENLIREKLKQSPNILITEEIIKYKAQGLSSAIESAIGYWQSSPLSLNAKVLSRYYFLLQLTIAEQVSSTKNVDGLKEVQRHTEFGHGLATISDPNGVFPNNYYTYALTSGHFPSYIKSIGINLSEFLNAKREKDFSKINPKNVVNLSDLFRRIPELSEVIEEHIGEPSLCLNIGHSEKNMIKESEAIEKHIKETGKFLMKLPETSDEKVTYISIYPRSEKMTLEYLSSLNLPIKDLSNYSPDMLSGGKSIVGKFSHPSKDYWYQHIPLYSSSYAVNSYIVPLWGRG